MRITEVIVENRRGVGEAFGRDTFSNLDKELKKSVPKNAAEIIGGTVSVVGALSGLVAGAIKGISFVSPDALLANIGYMVTGSFGAALGATLGVIPGALISGRSKSYGKRERLKQEKVAAFLQKNPTLLKDTQKFVQDLISQTPVAIIKNANYITHLTIDRTGSGEIDNDASYGLLDTQTGSRVKETKKLIYSYFSQKEKEWEALAKKYNIDAATLHQLVNEYGSNTSIEEQWLNGIKNKITSPVQGVQEGLDPYRLERLDPQSRRVLQRMADHKEPGSWLSASEAYAIMLGLQYKSRNPRGWEQEVQHYVDLWREITGKKS